MHRRIFVALGLAALFGFRLAYGLASEFWSEDERQVYLIGLRAFARGEWPFFGPDVVWTNSEIPGALQGLLIAVPLRLWPAPEAPFVLLNLLSFAALVFFAWYVAVRLPGLPRSWLLVYLATLPWTLNFSTHVVNPSYVLPAAILFFVGFCEAASFLRAGAIQRPAAFAMMAFALVWLAQIHLSFVLLPPYVLAALWSTPASERRSAILALAAGAMLPLALLLPTLLTFGLGGVQRDLVFTALSPWQLVLIVAKFLSFSGFELTRFLGLSVGSRLLLLSEHPWLVPGALLLSLAGLAQPLLVLFFSLRGATPWPHWNALRAVVAASLLGLYLSYFFSVKEPLAHAFYVLFPLSALLSAHVWALLWPRPAFRLAAKALLVVGVAFHAGLAATWVGTRSLYCERAIPATAIALRDDRLLGERRGLEEAERAAPAGDPQADIRVTKARLRVVGRGQVAAWKLHIRNEGRPAWSDVRYDIRYFDAAGAPAGEGGGVLKEILEPGEEQTIEVADGPANPRHVGGEVRIVDATRLPPLPRTEGSASIREPAAPLAR